MSSRASARDLGWGRPRPCGRTTPFSRQSRTPEPGHHGHPRRRSLLPRPRKRPHHRLGQAPRGRGHPRLHHSRRGGPRRHRITLPQGRLQEPRPAGATEQAPRRRRSLRPPRPGPAHPEDHRRRGRARPLRQARLHPRGRHAGRRRASRLQGRHGRHDVPVALLRLRPRGQEGPRRGRAGRAVGRGDADAHLPAQVPPPPHELPLQERVCRQRHPLVARLPRPRQPQLHHRRPHRRGHRHDRQPEPGTRRRGGHRHGRLQDGRGRDGHPPRRVSDGRPREEPGRLDNRPARLERATCRCPSRLPGRRAPSTATSQGSPT